jgi:hypothetical protein
MIRQQSDKPKRGTVFYWTEGKKDVWIERVKSDTVYFVCDSPNRPVDGNYFDVDVSELLQHKKAGKGLVSKPKPLTIDEKKRKADLNVFFASQTLVMPFLCDNCRQPLYAFSSLEKRAVIAHILPKSNKQSVGFPTVATHPQNKMFLCAKGGCHHRWDNKWAEDRQNMACYALALERFEQFKNLLTPEEIIKATKYLNLK